MLLFGFAPVFAGAISFSVMNAIGMAIDGGGGHGKHAHGPGAIYMVFMLVGMLIYLSAIIVGSLVFRNKFLQFEIDNTVMDGQRCRYTATPMDLLKAMIVPVILTSLTMGIYTPWMWVKYWQFQFENTEVNGQRGRLTFHGDGGTLLGKFILGIILTYCTLGIYGAWFANDIFAFHWENTKLDGRGFGFRKDPGGFLGTYILTLILSYCTLFIYLPWGICNIKRWEYERVT
jgi:uncharacterized membrane protein YjgN (DUF898 family)